MIILLNLISLNNNIAQFDDRAVRRPRGAVTARHDRAGWTGKNLILDEALGTQIVRVDFGGIFNYLFLWVTVRMVVWDWVSLGWGRIWVRPSDARLITRVKTSQNLNQTLDPNPQNWVFLPVFLPDPTGFR